MKLANQSKSPHGMPLTRTTVRILAHLADDCRSKKDFFLLRLFQIFFLLRLDVFWTFIYFFVFLAAECTQLS
jgi:hypothetical protein